MYVFLFIALNHHKKSQYAHIAADMS